MAKPDKSGDETEMVCRNRRAYHDFEIISHLECGIMLHGSEVKSIRAHKVSLEEAYVRVNQSEVWLIGCDISEYPQANYLNHEPRRARKLLLHRREIRKFAELAKQKGLTLIPLELYFKAGHAKLNVGLARGRKEYDKREKLKKDADRREMQQAMRRADKRGR